MISEAEQKACKKLQKANLLGQVKEYEYTTGNKIQFAQLGDTSIMYIPDNVTIIRPKYDLDYYRDIIKRLTKRFEVYGGRGLTTLDNLFQSIKDLDVLDISNLDTSNVISMNETFFDSSINHINFGDFKTNNVRSMRRMFSDLKTDELILNTFNTSSVRDMSSMFENLDAEFLDITSFETDKLKKTLGMFSNCKAVVRIRGKRMKALYMNRL